MWIPLQTGKLGFPCLTKQTLTPPVRVTKGLQTARPLFQHGIRAAETSMTPMFTASQSWNNSRVTDNTPFSQALMLRDVYDRLDAFLHRTVGFLTQFARDALRGA
jgi:hypothetical protein